MSRQDTLKALKAEQNHLQAQLNGIVKAMSALGATDTPVKAKGWPKGKKRGPRKPKVAEAPPKLVSRLRKANSGASLDEAAS
jgi:hypothetical protein